MLTKILLTIAVIIAAMLYVRTQNSKPTKPRPAPPPPPQLWGVTVTAERLAYGLLVVFLLISALVYFYYWREQQKIINIRVFADSSNSSTLYQARRSDINGRHFLTIDGREVKLGSADRMEVSSE
ncbi:MAG TPA: hypothetical protein ENI62_12500 [Gammaproteobacteria bacterium]|nr:hypothetical protein [Gammaproteobacteria bacterium]